MPDSQKKALRIMVIDNDGVVRHLIARVLKGDGHAVLEIGSMHQALDTLSRCTPHLILSDVNMPGVDTAFFGAIRTRCPYIPIIAMSCAGIPPEVADFQFEEWVQKPFDIYCLLRVIDSVYSYG